MSLTIPTEITDFVSECSEGFDNTTASMNEVYEAKVFSHEVSGSGFCTKVEIKAAAHDNAGEDRVILEFAISDGEYSIPCIVHNCEEAYIEEPLEEAEITNFLKILTDSQKKGQRVCITGHYINYGRKRLFICNSAQLDDGFKDSQLTERQFKQFKKLCDNHRLTPLDLMISDETLWAELFAQDYLKKAIMLFALSPIRKQDMIHVGIVSSHGEGKDHLVERVLQPLVPCRMAGSGKMSTIPGLFGAMSGDDLSCIEIGLLPKMNHERVAVSEFQTWSEETFGELMNMMANGKIEMQKGALDVQRETCLNLLFLGNPPKYYDEEKHNKRVMLDAFGQYTYQIISRLTLIFTQLSLNGNNVQKEIRNAIVSSMDGDFRGGENEDRLTKWRQFFREYLRYVSKIQPKLRNHAPRINSSYDEMEARPQFTEAFCVRSATDNRKYQEFLNLVRAFARLYGDDEINWKHLQEARDLFEVSLQTLTEEFPLSMMMENVDNELIEIYKKIQKHCPMAESLAEIREFIKVSHEQIETLIRSEALQRFADGAYFLNEGWLEKMGVGVNE